MNDPGGIDNLIKRARGGEVSALNELADLAHPRLEELLYRQTLDEDLTQDVVQESLIDMVKVLGKLERSDRFRPWLRRIALNKLRDRWRVDRRRREVYKDLARQNGLGRAQEPAGQGRGADKGLAEMVSGEISEIVVKSMRQLKADHRQVLTLRCYEDMSYAQIAETMERSEFGTRMLFFRAKKALQRELGRNGLGKGALLTALVVFGKLTARTQASAARVSVGAETLKVGAAAGLAAAASSTAGIATTAAVAATAGALIAGAAASGDRQQQSLADPVDTAVRQVQAAAGPCLAYEDRVVQWWLYYPRGRGSEVMARALAQSQGKAGAYCVWLYKGRDSYYYDRDKRTVYVYQGGSEAPGGPAELAEQMRRVARFTAERMRRIGPGTLVQVGFDEQGLPVIEGVDYRPGLDKEECFRFPWPAGVEVKDYNLSTD